MARFNNQFVCFLFSFVLILLLGSCSARKETSLFSEELDQYLSKQFSDTEPGGAILIAKGDSVVFAKGYGLADLQTKEPVTTKTLFNLGSISKTFVSNAILILQEEHKLSVEDSLIKYFPNFKNKDIARRVKIKHLLSHTSGLPDLRKIVEDSLFYLTARDAENWYPITQSDSLEFEPGSRFAYSNPAYNGLALIVEQVSGMKWQTFVGQRILIPSGMKTSTITDGSHPRAGVSHGYSWINGRWTEDDYGEEPTFAAAGNGGVWSSVEELALYEQALSHHVFLRPEAIALSRTPFEPANWSAANKPEVGWSWFIKMTSDSLRMMGHTGSQGGFLCNYQTLPDKRLHVIILCNAPRDVAGMTARILDVLRRSNWLDNH